MRRRNCRLPRISISLTCQPMSSRPNRSSSRLRRRMSPARRRSLLPAGAGTPGAGDNCRTDRFASCRLPMSRRSWRASRRRRGKAGVDAPSPARGRAGSQPGHGHGRTERPECVHVPLRREHERNSGTAGQQHAADAGECRRPRGGRSGNRRARSNVRHRRAATAAAMANMAVPTCRANRARGLCAASIAAGTVRPAIRPGAMPSAFPGRCLARANTSARPARPTSRPIISA